MQTKGGRQYKIARTRYNLYENFFLIIYLIKFDQAKLKYKIESTKQKQKMEICRITSNFFFLKELANIC